MSSMLDPVAVAKACQCSADNVTANLPILADAMTEYGYHPEMHTNLWIAVLATVAVETAHLFKPVTEFGSQAYLESKPYYPWVGRGFLQTTWKSNYMAVDEKLDTDCEHHPEQLLDPVTSAKALMIYVTGHQRFIDAAHESDWRTCRIEVNGGLNGWDSFIAAVNALVALAQS